MKSILELDTSNRIFLTRELRKAAGIPRIDRKPIRCLGINLAPATGDSRSIGPCLMTSRHRCCRSIPRFADENPARSIIALVFHR